MSEERGFISLKADGHTWLFAFDPSPRSLMALFDVLIEYERDPESGFTSWHATQVLRGLAHHLCANAASRRTAGILSGIATTS
ncbi:hypothetical protein [Schlesneria paludicola]|uniref:hypothetical protein n=1 Tax=Schlesneria paludicola TaxID=360056 RepID=UPI00029B3710|nr:hypothetical protein [Schlesneria paludicola]